MCKNDDRIHAWKVAEQINSWLSLKNGILVYHEEMKEYQQGNTFDCGSFVIENAERAIYQTFVEEDDGSNFEPCHKTDLNGKRDESLINNQQGSTMGPFEVWFKAWEWFMGSI